MTCVVNAQQVINLQKTHIDELQAEIDRLTQQATEDTELIEAQKVEIF